MNCNISLRRIRYKSNETSPIHDTLLLPVSDKNAEMKKKVRTNAYKRHLKGTVSGERGKRCKNQTIVFCDKTTGRTVCLGRRVRLFKLLSIRRPGYSLPLLVLLFSPNPLIFLMLYSSILYTYVPTMYIYICI